MGVQCLLTVEGGFVHAQIISGVSVPLGLWKPSLATINRSAGCKHTLARRQALPARVERAVLSLPPLSPTRLDVTCAGECGCIFPKTLRLIGFERRDAKSEKLLSSQCRRWFDESRRFLSRCGEWKSHLHSA